MGISLTARGLTLFVTCRWLAAGDPVVATLSNKVVKKRDFIGWVLNYGFAVKPTVNDASSGK